MAEPDHDKPAMTISSSEMQRLYDGLKAEKRVLELIASGASLSEVLQTLSASIEEQSDGARCSLCLLDDDGVTLKNAAAPSLPAAYLEEKGDVVAGPRVGSCGTAVFRKEAVVVSDIATDPLWADYRDLALRFGLRACWSTPIMSSSGSVLGTFAMYYGQSQEASPHDRQLVERATHVAGIAIERERSDEALRVRAEELEALNQQLMAAHAQLAESERQLKGYASRLERTVEIEHAHAVTDSLTGLANHRGAHVQLDTLVAQAREQERPVSLILGDIDGFKLFNDTYGHTCGDDVLKLVANVCQAAIGPEDVACRYGGDEFVIILPGKDRSAADAVARRISETFGESEFITADGSRVPVTLALGHATFPRDATTAEQLIAAADGAMYEAKRAASERLSPSSTVSSAEATDSTFGVLDSLVQAIDAKDRYTKRHSDGVAEYGMKLAARLDLSEEARRALRIAGLLHDIGKLAVPDEVLKKPGSLTHEEYEIVKRHVVIGEVLIREVPQLNDVIQAVSCHHERYDGSGYPRGLQGTRIPLLGRVIAVADAYSAMVLDRPYRKALALDEIVRELQAGAGTQFDPEIVPVFIDLLLDESGQQRAA